MDIICVGAAAMDIVVEVDQLPREDDIVMAKRIREYPGGSTANVCIGLAKLGLKVGFVGKLVNDKYGTILIDEFKKNSIDLSATLIVEHGQTATCMIFVDNQGKRMIVGMGGTAILENTKELNLEYFSSTPFVYIGEAFPEIALKIIDYVHKHGNNIVYAPGGVFSNYGLSYIEPVIKNSDILILSRAELLKLLKETIVLFGIKKLSKITKSKIIVTLGKNGAVLWDNKKMLRINAFNVKNVKDTTGAGDAFVAGLLFGLVQGKNLLESIMMGNAVASLKIQHYGARVGLPTYELVKDFLSDKKLSYNELNSDFLY